MSLALEPGVFVGVSFSRYGWKNHWPHGKFQSHGLHFFLWVKLANALIT